MNNQRLNFDPKVWGPHAWEFLDMAVLSFPQRPGPDDVKSMRAFLESVAYALPCESCRIHYAQYLEASPLTDELLGRGREALVEWLLRAHNRVRAFGGKRPIEMHEMLDYYLGSGTPTVHLETHAPEPRRAHAPHLWLLLAAVAVCAVFVLRGRVR